MRYEEHDWVASVIRLGQVLCKCDDPACDGKHLDPKARPRTQKMLSLAGSLLKEYERCYDHGWRITSCQRCVAHNKAVGGSPDSAHIHNCAIDIVTKGPIMDLVLLAEQQGCWSQINWSLEREQIHLDLHPDDKVRRGYRDVAGVYRVRAMGTRYESPLLKIVDWNVDETREPPGYVNAYLQRERPV